MTKEDLEILGCLVAAALLWASWPLWVPRWDRALCRSFWNKNPALLRIWQFYRDDGLDWSPKFKAPTTVLAMAGTLTEAWVLKKKTPAGTLWVRWVGVRTLDPLRPKTHVLWQTLGEAVLDVQPPTYLATTLSWRSQRKELPYSKHRDLQKLLDWAARIVLEPPFLDEATIEADKLRPLPR